jgi:hypothetical protein
MSGLRKNGQSERIISALLNQPTHEAAAGAAGISVATLYRWLAKPEFQASYNAARKKVVELAIGKLQSSMSEAVETLRAVMSDEHKASDRVRAALGILDHAVAGTQLLDLSERLDAIEQTLKDPA